jgi:murein DD-endopeptidase MepM/ murein hydrolase activator NlpD
MSRLDRIVTVLLIVASAVTLSATTRSSQAGEPTSSIHSTALLQVENVALGKPVIVMTNGANDNRESPGLYPSDITDGSLDYLPSSSAQEDGSVGYVNNDYSQLMVITVTIDLQGTYDISRIRYNMGHVERAETWNADSMTTPLGTTGTNPGTPYTGAWTEQTGSASLSSVTVVLEKTRISWPTDWLFIGEIEIYGTPAGAHRPVFDLPINYAGRGNPTEQQFVAAWQGCTTSFLDHRYPLEYDGFLVPFWGAVLSGSCTDFETCYDGHEGYDFDDSARCGGSPLFPVASGTIVSAFCDRSPNPPHDYRYYGCQVRIRHGNSGYESLYGHLQEDSWFSSTQGRIGTTVTASDRIGTIGCTGHCHGSHLHLSVYYEGSYVDPSGWQGNYEDPYVRDRGGPASHRLWLFSPRRSTPVNHALGTNLVSPSGNTLVSVPPNAYDEDFELTVTELAPVLIPSQLASARHGLVLEARSVSGGAIERLNEDTTLEIRFEASDLEGVRANTLSLYAWSAESNEWIILPTTVNLPSVGVNVGAQGSGTASTVIRELRYIALLGEPYLTYLPVVLK